LCWRNVMKPRPAGGREIGGSSRTGSTCSTSAGDASILAPAAVSRSPSSPSRSISRGPAAIAWISSPWTPPIRSGVAGGIWKVAQRTGVSAASRARAGSLAHLLEVGLASVLEQAPHAAVEVLHAEAQELGDEIVGAAAPGDAPGAGDDLDAALHHLLHFRMGLLAGVAHGLRQVAGPGEIHIHARDLDQPRAFFDGLHLFNHQANDAIPCAFLAEASGGALTTEVCRATTAH